MGYLIAAAYLLTIGYWLGHAAGKKAAKDDLKNAVVCESILRTATSDVDKTRLYVGNDEHMQVRYNGLFRMDGKHYRMLLEREDAK